MIARFVGETATELSHEVNNPVVLVIGFVIVLSIGIYLLIKLDESSF